jgi:hypothetical protein
MAANPVSKLRNRNQAEPQRGEEDDGPGEGGKAVIFWDHHLFPFVLDKA